MAFLVESSLQRPGAATANATIDGRLLTVYLRDHHALLVVLAELAGRVSGRRDERHAFAQELSEAAADDRACLEAVLARLGSGPSHSRQAAMWTAEKLGRLKLNGRVVRPSPLSAVTELEGCRLMLEGDRALWSGLAGLALGPADAAERAQRAERLLATAEELRSEALAAAIRAAAQRA